MERTMSATLIYLFCVTVIDDLLDDKDNICSSSSDVKYLWQEKLARAQRMRLHKEKKLRQTVSICSSVIGPVLPSPIILSSEY